MGESAVSSESFSDWRESKEPVRSRDRPGGGGVERVHRTILTLSATSGEREGLIIRGPLIDLNWTEVITENCRMGDILIRKGTALSYVAEQQWFTLLLCYNVYLCIVLYFTVLYCILLYCTVLYCLVLYWNGL